MGSKMPRKAPDGLRPLREIAEAINVHLKRFEANPAVNIPRNDLHPYYRAGSWYPGAGKVSVMYVSYQGPTKMTRAEAEQYLAWLDAGNAGKHYQIPKDWTPNGAPDAT
jgi:hypothetical protein